MSTSIKEELRKVIKLTLNKRIWLYVKDHPHTTAGTLEKVLKETLSATSTSLGALVRRGMLNRVSVVTRNSKRIFEYTAPAKMTEYELLPVDKSVVLKDYQHKTAMSPITVSQNGTPVIPSRANLSGLALNVENLTLAEARIVYDKLHILFGKGR